jgi:outer membrane protein
MGKAVILKKCILIAMVILAACGACSGQAIDTLSFDKAVWLVLRQSPEMVQADMTLAQSQALYDAAVAAQKLSVNLTLSPIGYTNDLQLSPNDIWDTTRNIKSTGQLQLSQPVLLTGGTVALSGDLGWNDLYTSFSRAGENRSFDYHTSISYSQPLLVYNQLKMNLRQQELTLETNQLTYAIAALAIEASIAGDYYGLYQDQMNFQIAQESYKSARQSYDIAEVGVASGKQAKSDLYQASVTMTQNKSDMKNKEITWQNAAEALKQRLGIPLDTPIELTIDTNALAMTIDLQKAITSGLRQRMELRQDAITIENARFALVQAKSNGDVSGNLNLSYGLVGANRDFNVLFNNPAKNLNASLSVQVPIWDFGANRARVKASEIGLRQDELLLGNEKTTIVVAIRKEYRLIQNLQEQIELARETLRFAALTYDVNLEKFKLGGLSAMDLNQYQIQLSQAKSGLVSALVNYRIELLNMKVQSLYDFQKDQPAIPESSKPKE